MAPFEEHVFNSRRQVTSQKVGCHGLYAILSYLPHWIEEILGVRYYLIHVHVLHDN